MTQEYTHCPRCGDSLPDRNFCRHCGDIGDLDEYKDDQRKPEPPTQPMTQAQFGKAAVDFAFRKIFG